MIIDDMINMANEGPLDELDDHLATLSYARLNEILRYLSDNNAEVFGHEVLRGMVEDHKTQIERDSHDQDT